VYGIPTFIRLDHHVDRFDFVEPFGVAIFAPVCRAGQSDCGDSLAPQRVDVGFAFGEYDMLCDSGVKDAVQAIEARVTAGLPAETVAILCDAEADR